MKDPDYFTRLRMVLLGDGKQKRIRTRMMICHERRVSIPAFFFLKKAKGAFETGSCTPSPQIAAQKEVEPAAAPFLSEVTEGGGLLYCTST